VNPAIGNNLNVPVGEQQINQHAAVVLGVPYPQLRKHVDSAFFRGLSFEEQRTIQCSFRHETYFSDV
jgi:hypothetical protein